MSLLETEDRPKVRVIRDKAFAKRLEIACEGNPHCPTDQHRGKQKWIYDKLLEEFGVRVSPEAVRKWFYGESRPRPKIMSYVARLLEVDEAWLSLGIKPDLAPVERKQHNAMAQGAVNLVAGIIQLEGGSIAFPDSGAHIHAILKGKSLAIDVVLPRISGDEYRVLVSDQLEGKHVLVVIEEEAFGFAILVLTPDIIRDAGSLRGDFWEVVIEQRGVKFRAGHHQVRQMTSMRDLLLVAPQPPPMQG